MPAALKTSCALIALVTPMAVLAQEASAGLDDIIVTAERRETRLQQTPISVVALSGEALAQRGVSNLTDLATSAPNLTAQGSPAGGSSGGQFFIRGVGQFDFIVTQEPSVGLYIDGVYIGRTAGAALDLVDIDRIEVLRGPQGTLFGRNTTGGAVQIISRKPGANLGASGELTLGSRKRFDVKLSADIPLVDDILTSNIAFASYQQDGYGRRIVTGKRTGDRDTLAGRAQFALEASDDLRFLLAFDGSRRRGAPGVETLIGIDLASPLSAPAVAYNDALIAQGFTPIGPAFIASNRLNSYATHDKSDDYDVFGTSLTAEWDLGSVRLKSITAYRSLEADTGADFDATPYPFLEQDIEDDQDQISQELQLSGTAFQDRLRWIGGLFYYRERAKQFQDIILFQPVTRTGPGAYDFVGAGGLNQLALNDQTTKSYAAFAQADYQFTDQLSMTAGLRYSEERKSLLSSVGIGAPDNIRAPSRVSNTWHNLSPKLSLQYRPTNDILVYGSVSRGFRSGGFNGRATTPTPPNSYGQENIWAYEGGLKSEWLDRRLRFNLSGFYYDYKDYQGTKIELLNIEVGNIASVELWGFEAELSAVPADGLRLEAAVGRLAQKIGAVDPGAVITINANTRLINTPKWTANLGGQYDVALGSLGDLSFRADASYRTTTEFLLPNLPGERQGGYWLLNGRVGLALPGSQWKLEAYGLNLTDKRYKVYAQNQIGFGTAVTIARYGRPREFGVTLKAGF